MKLLEMACMWSAEVAILSSFLLDAESRGLEAVGIEQRLSFVRYLLEMQRLGAIPTAIVRSSPHGSKLYSYSWSL